MAGAGDVGTGSKENKAEHDGRNYKTGIACWVRGESWRSWCSSKKSYLPPKYRVGETKSAQLHVCPIADIQ